MALTFPTGQTAAHRPGTPARASHCQCHGGPLQLTDEHACDRCGKHTKQTISNTWRQRAAVLAAIRRA